MRRAMSGALGGALGSGGGVGGWRVVSCGEQWVNSEC